MQKSHQSTLLPDHLHNGHDVAPGAANGQKKGIFATETHESHLQIIGFHSEHKLFTKYNHVSS